MLSIPAGAGTIRPNQKFRIEPNFSFAEEQSLIILPKTIEEAKKIGENALETKGKEFSGIVKKIWQEQILPFWQKIWNWFKKNIWFRIEGWFKPEIEKRKEFFKENFEQEKEELKTEVPKVSKSLWEKFKELIR